MSLFSKILGGLKSAWNFFNNLSLKIKIVVIVILLIAIAFLSSRVFTKKDSGYIVEPVKTASITQTVSETGNIIKGSSVEVVSPSTGIIEEVYVSNGDNVLEGDLLFKVQATATEQEQQEAYSNYLAASAALNAANSTAHVLKSAMLDSWDQYFQLATNSTYENDDGSPKSEQRVLPEFNIAQENWLAAEKQYKDQQTEIAQAQAKVSSTWLKYQATQNAEVKATANGTIANLAIIRGSDVKASTPALAIVSETSDPFVKVSINEIDVPKIMAGQKVKVEIDAIDDKSFNGVVDRVDSIGKNTQGVITYDLYVKLLDNNSNIRSGMTANVDVSTQSKQASISVPNNAIKPYQGGKAVQVLEKGKPEYVPVQTGVKGDERTEIISGLKPGQEIIIGAKNDLIQREGSFGF